MDTHHSANFPGPPVRLATEGTSRCSKSNDVREENGCTSTPCHSGKQKLIVKGIKDHPVIIASGRRGLPFSPPTGTGSSSSSSHVVTSAAPPLACSSSQRSYMSRKGPTQKPDLLSNDSINAHCIQSGQSLCISESSPHDDSFVDLTKRNLHRHVNGKALKNGDLKNNQADSQKKFGLPNLGSSHNTACFPNVSCNANGCEDRNKVGRSIDSAEVGATRNQSVSSDSPSVCPIVPPRVNRIRRLVRNGCISPNNIAKGKQLVGGDVNGSANVSHHSNVSGPSAAPISVEIMELVANEDDSHMRKGKGVINNPCNSNGLDPRDKNLHDRDSMSFKRKAESGGCRHIHNQTAEMSRPLSPHVEQHFVRETDCSRGSRPHHANISHRRVQLGKLNGTRSAARAHIKRQKLGSTSSSYVEPAPSAFNDSEVAHVSSSAEASNPKSSSSTAGVLQQIIEVDCSSPQFRRNSHDEAARARQVEADELLARELQEQFYSELPASDAGEVDMQIAAAMQQQDDSNRGFSWASHHPLIERGSTAFNLQTQPQSRPSNIPRRGSHGRASRGRASTLRGTRLRNRFPGQPRTLLPSRGRSSLFPEHLDVDMRMHILGALEDISDTGMATSILRSQHDFNENDYEMLLALDDNNDRHGGAPIHLINGLPQSTVQNDNFDEDCAICLDTPTTGDTIRHLPCLHKFHKDCVDLWLRRKTSCPICKSSIT